MIEGNSGRRPIKPEVKAKGKPRPPKSFDEAHVEVWNALLEEFPDEFLTLADNLTIERTVRSIALYRRCSDEVDNERKLLLKVASNAGCRARGRQRPAALVRLTRNRSRRRW